MKNIIYKSLYLLAFTICLSNSCFAYWNHGGGRGGGWNHGGGWNQGGGWNNGGWHRGGWGGGVVYFGAPYYYGNPYYDGYPYYSEYYCTIIPAHYDAYGYWIHARRVCGYY